MSYNGSKALGSKLFFFGVLPFKETVGDEQDQIPGFHFERYRDGAIHLWQDPQRQGLRVQITKGSSLRIVDEKRSLACGKQLHLVAAFFQHNSNESSKALWWQISSKGVINVLEGCRQTIASIETCT